MERSAYQLHPISMFVGAVRRSLAYARQHYTSIVLYRVGYNTILYYTLGLARMFCASTKLEEEEGGKLIYQTYYCRCGND